MVGKKIKGEDRKKHNNDMKLFRNGREDGCVVHFTRAG